MKILVILAAYNGEKYIKKQIESILHQEGVFTTIMVFDDMSVDNTVSVVKAFLGDNRVKLIQNSKASGSAANNFLNAIKFIDDEILCEFDFVSFADQDDLWLPQKLLVATENLKHIKSGLYMSNLTLWHEKINLKTTIKKDFKLKSFDFLFESGSAGCTYVFTKTFCLSLKKTLFTIDYANWKYFSHDWLVYFFARVNKLPVFIDGKSYILYRIHENNVHGFLNVNSFKAIKFKFKTIKAGWYFEHIKGFIQLLDAHSTEMKIYKLYTRNYFSRLFVLICYNFSLMRSPIKFLQFFIVSLIPVNFKNSK